MTSIALTRQPHSEFLAKMHTIGLALGARGGVGVGLATQRGGATVAAEPWYSEWGYAWLGKGAASRSDSLLNLASGGVQSLENDDPNYGNTPPGWNASDGWTFNGSTDAFSTGLHAIPIETVVMIEFNVTGNGLYGGLFGAFAFTYGFQSVDLALTCQTWIAQGINRNGGEQSSAPFYGTPHNLCMTRERFYVDGQPFSLMPSLRTRSGVYPAMKLGATGGNFHDRPNGGFFQGSIKAAAVRNSSPASDIDAWVAARYSEMHAI